MIRYHPNYNDGHDFFGHIHAWPDQDGFSDLFVRALNNAIGRDTIRPSPYELIEKTPAKAISPGLRSCGVQIGGEGDYTKHVDGLLKRIKSRSQIGR